MSPPNSNEPSLFDEVDFQAAEPSEGYDPGVGSEPVAAAPPRDMRSRPMDIYTLLLVLSFIALTTAAVFFFMDAAKY